MPGSSAHDPPVPGLPLILTRFIGREQELEDLVRLLPSTRLLTLTGAGGSGKTRLALEATHRCVAAFERVAWVDLAPLVEAELIPGQVALALGAPERPGTAWLTLIRERIGDASILLVLDNCEHLVDACAVLVARLLRECPRLVVLSTSREALGVPGETAWLVPPLASPEAMQLFLERAQAVLPGFAATQSNRDAIAEICRRLDGIPLAIELAAARIRVLSPEQIAERLSDSFRLLSGGSRTALARHRTLRGAMDWSFALLSEPEQALLRRLAVFAETFPLDAVEAICSGSPIAPDELLDGLSALVDKSLLVLGSSDGEARYRLLETVRQYAAEHLSEAGERGEVEARHAAYFLALAEHAAPRLFGGAADPTLVTRLTVETANLRRVAEWALEDPGRNETALRLGTALHWFWFAKGRFEEGRQRLEQAVAVGAWVPPRVRAWALIALGHVHIWQGNPSGGLPRMEEALHLLQDLDDPEGLAYALNGVGASIYLGGDSIRCVRYFEEALRLAPAQPNRVLEAIILYYQGRAAQDRGDLGAARAGFERATAVGRSIGNRPAIAHPLTLEGRLAYAERRFPDALACLGESLELHEANDDPWGQVLCLEGIAYVAAARRRFERAARLLGAAAALRERIAAPVWPTERADHDRVLAAVRQGLGEAFDAAWNAGRAGSREDSVALGLEIARAGATATHPAMPAVRAPGPPIGAPDLDVRALGPLQVMRAGEALDPATWGSARPRELLVFLLLHPQGCSKEQAGAALWPEASTAQVRNSFHVTLHRLRKGLGRPEWILTAQERYRLDPTLRVLFDAARFESEITAALRAAARGAADAGRLAEVLELYRGDLLEGEPAGDWHLAHRERLQRLYLDGMMARAAALMDQSRFSDAAEACRRVLARDDLHEEAWRRLMSCHAENGERAQALRLYQQLAELLRKELDTEPDPATTALYHRLQQGAPVRP